jgi:hypothetical protein
MINFISSPLRKQKYQSTGYAETVQYFNNKPFDSKIKQES